MDVYGLKEHIKSNPETIELILEKAGFCDISDKYSRGSEYRCAWKENGDPTKVRVDIESLNSSVFGENIKGDLLTVVQKKLNYSFSKTVDFVAKVINYEDVEVKDSQFPFGGFYKKIQRFRDNDMIELVTYDDLIISDYNNNPNLMFLEDGITVETQQYFDVGYDLITDRITIVWRDTTGKIVGVMGRKNKRVVEEGENKYFPIIKFPKGRVVYGFSNNYNMIQQHKKIYIGESEKFTQKLHSWSIPLGVSLGGSNLTEIQANNIKSLLCDKIIIGLDEGLDEEISVEMAKKLKMNRYFKNEVYYLHDKNNLYLPKDSKMSPTDLPKEDFARLVKHCAIKYE